MKPLVPALALLGLVAAAPTPAHAHVSFAFSLPGFTFLAADPYPYPPAPAPRYYVPSYYAAEPAYYAPPRRHGCHRGWWRHGRRWDR